MQLRSLLKSNKESRIPNCSSFICRPDQRHKKCIFCGDVCCGSSIYIEPSSLKRSIKPMCEDCMMFKASDHNEKYRLKRTQKDWAQLTDPKDMSYLHLNKLVEQYSGPTRATLRAFLDSDADVAIVDDISVTTLNQSIRSLGLEKLLYSETRNNNTILRRIEQPKKRR